MKADPRDPLLTAVLIEDDAFRADTLRATLSLARRRRRGRIARRTLAAAVLCAVALRWHLPPPPPASKPAITESGAMSIRSTPSPTLTIVRTQATAVTKIASRPSAVAIVTTGDAMPRLDYLSDQQLFAALPNKRAALIAPGTPDARVIFY